jgi:hypothetical protein
MKVTGNEAHDHEVSAHEADSATSHGGYRISSDRLRRKFYYTIK